MEFIKVFFQVLLTLLVLYMITLGTGLMTAPSDMSVLVGVILIFATLPLYWYGTRFIWRIKKNVTNKKEGS